jgi:hypothetical protein
MISGLRYIGFCAAFVGVISCDVSGGGSADGASSSEDAELSTCTYPFVKVNAGGKTIGQRCSANSECEYDFCMMPGMAGNGTGEFGVASNLPVNTQFGFCSRGCDCNNDTTSRLTDEEKLSQVCYYGPVGSQGKVRFVMAKCTDVSACAGVDSGYSECAKPNGSGTTKACLAP